MDPTASLTQTERIAVGRAACAPWMVWGLLIVITAIGAWLRLAHLGDRAMPGDELEVWRTCRDGVSVGSILRREVPLSLQPFLLAYIQGVRQIFDLPVSFFSLRLPGALLGVLSIPLLYLAGRTIFGRYGGLLPAALLAANPYHVQCSREAYPYILGTTGFTLGLWCVFRVLEGLRTGRGPGVAVFLACPPALLAMLGASISTWPIAFLVAVAFVGAASLHWQTLPRRRWPLAASLAIALACLTPYFWSKLANLLSGGVLAQGLASYNVTRPPLFDPLGLEFLTRFAWGISAPRLALMALVLALSGAAVWRRRKERELWVVVGLLLLGFAMTMVSRYATQNPFHPRFMVPMLPAYMLALSAGILLPVEAGFLHGTLPRSARVTALGAWFLLLFAAWANPLRQVILTTGAPFPYREIVAWADAHLPPGTPVLCDRFFDAYNEFIVNAPTSAVFMGTIHNEPMARFEQEHWRDTAVDFLRRNPDAAFYEAKMFWEHFGPWEWPHQYFARHEGFLDPAFFALLRMGLAYREWDGPLDEPPRSIYYNTRSDLVAKAVAEGQQAFAVFDQGWQYVKTQDYRDWRMMGGAATVDVYNLRDQPCEVSLQIAALAGGRDKTIRLPQGGSATFPANQPVRATLGPITLQPGRNRIQIEDPAGPGDTAPLLVHEVNTVVGMQAPP